MAKTVTSACNLGAVGSPISDVSSTIELTDDAEVFVKRSAADGFGGTPITPVSLGHIACRLMSAVTLDEHAEESQIVGVSIWNLKFARDAAIIPNTAHRLKIKGHVYEILDTNEDLSDATVITARVERIGRRIQ